MQTTLAGHRSLQREGEMERVLEEGGYRAAAGFERELGPYLAAHPDSKGNPGYRRLLLRQLEGRWILIGYGLGIAERLRPARPLRDESGKDFITHIEEILEVMTWPDGTLPDSHCRAFVARLVHLLRDRWIQWL
jgi:hypothetical protein